MNIKYLNKLIKEEIKSELEKEKEEEDKKEYTQKDALNAVKNYSFQFTLAGAKPIRGKRKELPSYYELNQTRDDSFKIYKIKNGYRIIVPLIGKTIHDKNLSVRKGDTFTIELYDANEKEIKTIASILNNNVKYDATAIQYYTIQ